MKCFFELGKKTFLEQSLDTMFSIISCIIFLFGGAGYVFLGPAGVVVSSISFMKQLFPNFIGFILCIIILIITMGLMITFWDRCMASKKLKINAIPIIIGWILLVSLIIFVQ
jgi:hypothetical protein